MRGSCLIEPRIGLDCKCLNLATSKPKLLKETSHLLWIGDSIAKVPHVCIRYIILYYIKLYYICFIDLEIKVTSY